MVFLLLPLDDMRSNMVHKIKLVFHTMTNHSLETFKDCVELLPIMVQRRQLTRQHVLVTFLEITFVELVDYFLLKRIIVLVGHITRS